jgi:hypothetical protein
MAERWRSDRERSSGRGERTDRMNLDSAGETILGRADWGDRESDYEHGFRPMHVRDDWHAAERQARWPRQEPMPRDDRSARGWSGRGDEQRFAGETILGRADWGDHESDYEHGYRAFREGHWPGDDRAHANRGEQGRAEQGRAEQGRGEQWSRERGGFSGRGPRGYQRNDQRVYEDVCDRLTEDARVDASDIEVRVENGEVTLAGTVKSRTEKHRAEDAIESITGVRDVHNHLRVGHGGIGEPGSLQTPLGLSGSGDPRQNVKK